jgi:hypothetical protein
MNMESQKPAVIQRLPVFVTVVVLLIHIVKNTKTDHTLSCYCKMRYEVFKSAPVTFQYVPDIMTHLYYCSQNRLTSPV